MSVRIFMADLCALQWTDQCNVEYEAQLNFKREKMRQQLKHLEALEQHIVQLNHQLESKSKKGISAAAAASGILRQNTNYHSLPLGAKMLPLKDHIVQQNDHRTDAQHCKDTASIGKFYFLADKDSANFSKVVCADLFGNPSDDNNIDLPVTTVGGVPSSCSSLPINSANWSQQTVMNNGISHSENLRNTSYRMMGRFALQQTDMQQSKQSEATCSSARVDHNTPFSSSDQTSAEITDCFPAAAESMKLPFSVNEHPELKQTMWSKDVVCPSLQVELDEVGSVVTDTSSRPIVDTNGCNESVLLPDVIGYLSDDVTLQNVIEHNSVSTLSVSAASKVPPPVAQKPKFRYPCLSGYGLASCESVAVSTQLNAVITVPVCSVDTVVSRNENSNNTSNITEMPYNTTFTVGQDLLLEKPELKNVLDESPLSISVDLSEKETLSGDSWQDLIDSSRLVDRPIYKHSITYPVRRRRSAGERCEFSSTRPSGDMQGNADAATVEENSPVCSEGSLSKVRTVKNKLQSGMSRRVQFEPLALLLDAALEGEIDLLQTTLKVRNFSFPYCTCTSLVLT